LTSTLNFLCQDEKVDEDEKAEDEEEDEEKEEVRIIRQ
jgi:hypothetical protein